RPRDPAGNRVRVCLAQTESAFYVRVWARRRFRRHPRRAHNSDQCDRRRIRGDPTSHPSGKSRTSRRRRYRGVIGFLGNEGVAIFRIRVGKEIGSAALVADGYHARTDGWMSLAVLFGALGVWLGVPLADPIVGLLITAAILVIVWW